MATTQNYPAQQLVWPIIIDGAKYPVVAASFENAFHKVLDGNPDADCEEFPHNLYIRAK